MRNRESIIVAAFGVIMGVCLTSVSVEAANAPLRPAASDGGRVVHFPADRSLGELHLRPPVVGREFEFWFHWTRASQQRPEYLGEARGDVRVPAGKDLVLTLSAEVRQAPSVLSRLQPNDLDGIMCEESSVDRVKATDAVMPYIAHLTGLKSLVISATNITDAGVGYIVGLRSLEELELSPQITDKGMVHIAGLTSLKRLYCDLVTGCNRITDAGLENVGRLTTLEELALYGEQMGDAGLTHLRNLPRLEYLYIRGTHFGDHGMPHLKSIRSLKMLVFHEGEASISNAGLAYIVEIPNLEVLHLDARGDVTDEGLALLTKLPRLKKLAIPKARVTDQGLGYLSRIRTLERLELPQDQKGITDAGVVCLGELVNLKQLNISRTHFADPNMNTEYYTDKSLEALAKCQNLRELSVGSPGITDAGLDDIAKLRRLTRLSLFGCEKLTDAGLAKLAALDSLESLSIFYGDFRAAGREAESRSSYQRAY